MHDSLDSRMGSGNQPIQRHTCCRSNAALCRWNRIAVRILRWVPKQDIEAPKHARGKSVFKSLGFRMDF